LKIKNMWYLKIHRAKDAIQFEKNVIGMIINNDLDDVLPEMEESDQNRVNGFADDLWHNMHTVGKEIDEIVKVSRVLFEEADEDNENKWFALNVVNHQPMIMKNILFMAWRGKDTYELVKECVLNNLGSKSNVEKIRVLIGGIDWDDY